MTAISCEKVGYMKEYTLPIDIGAWGVLFDNPIVKTAKRINNSTPLVSRKDTAMPAIGYRGKDGRATYFSDSDGDVSKLLELYAKLEASGFEILEVPYKTIAERFGDYVGYRDGNRIYIAADDGKREISAKEKAYIAAHEAKEKSHKFDGKPHDVVHKEAEDMLAGLKHYSALDIAKEVGKRMQWVN
ncbi:MAG: hypothetical protein HZB67_06250 [Candidatus Aenigmarchaeota archaeon]|nr:hypothetical protein [Candidatus Aenigmarchaeota archaeon]